MDNNNYIVFSSYYKHGETSTEIYQSLLEMFDKFLYINICECLEQIIMENTSDSESDNESDDDSDNDEDNENSKIENNILYKKYNKIYDKRYRSIEKNKKQDNFKILTENIETDEEILLNDIIKMNHNLFTNNWSIRTIIKVKKDYYTSYI